jgi:hypothetical protein
MRANSRELTAPGERTVRRGSPRGAVPAVAGRAAGLWELLAPGYFRDLLGCGSRGKRLIVPSGAAANVLRWNPLKSCLLVLRKAIGILV